VNEIDNESNLTGIKEENDVRKGIIGKRD